MLSNQDVIKEGFRPLKRAPTEPIAVASLSRADAPSSSLGFGGGRNLSFCAETGRRASAQSLWDDSPWTKMERSRGRVMERANSFHRGATGSASASGSGSATTSSADSAAAAAVTPKEAIIAIVDPFSTGAHLAAQASRLGYNVVRVFSIWDSPVAALVQEGVTTDYFATLQFDDRMEDSDAATDATVNALRALPLPVVAVIPGAETGVELADRLSARMALRSNGEEGSLARRNKYDMGEKVRAAGVRAVKQRLCRSEAELLAFFIEEFGIYATNTTSTSSNTGSISGSNFVCPEGFKCVVKPVQSAGTDHVFLCDSIEEARTAFASIHGHINGLGLVNDGALVQEFLAGKEYVIDKVSRDGEHKIVAVWEYDKRRCNDAAFVYFGNRLRAADSERAQEMIRYADSVLDALGIMQGPSHMEVMYTATGPCLVEVGSRCQGGEGTWLPIVEECIGYSQVSVTLDVYLGGALFDSIPKHAYKLKKAGRDVDVVSRHAGVVRAMPGDAMIRQLPSFRNVSWEVHPGDFCPLTIDCFTRPACVQLVHESEEQADRDFDRIHEIEAMGLIDYAIICPKPPPSGVVVVVDPFSTGAHLAATVLKWGYKLVLVFSNQSATTAGGVRVFTGTPADGNSSVMTQSAGPNSISAHKPLLMIQHDSSSPDQSVAVEATMQSIITKQPHPVLAVLAGAETGIDLADRLSARIGTRSNGEEKSLLRQSKYLAAEAAHNAGLRVPRQVLALTEEQVTAFWNTVVRGGGSGGSGAATETDGARVNAGSPITTASPHARCVIKPDMSLEGDSVTVCESLDAALAAFRAIHGQFNFLGRVNRGAVCMEYVEGTEFVLDTVSRDGSCKVISIWETDKGARATTTATTASLLPLVRGMRLRDCSTSASASASEMQEVCGFAANVLRVLGINHGPANLKVILRDASASGTATSTSRVPVLISAQAACQGGEGSWMPVSQACLGHTVVDASLNAFLRPDLFDALDHVPRRLLRQGVDAYVNSAQAGLVIQIPGLDKIKALPSFIRMDMLTQPGSMVTRSCDRFSRCGAVQLVADSVEQLEADYDALHDICASGNMFELLC